MIIDSHIHISPEFKGEGILEFLDRTNTEGAVIQTVWHTKVGSQVDEALKLKEIGNGNIFVFASPNRDEYFKGSDGLGKRQKNYIKGVISQGVDGIKMLEGKPQMRKTVPIPDFDDMVWDEFFSYVEEEQIPVMWHVNDPASYWDNNKDPWLVSQGWAYDESYINNEEQYRQVLEVVRRYPKLKVTFAHFMFLSQDLYRLSDIFEKYDNVSVDLTPGIEMYENFSNNEDLTRQFFDEYYDRIIYGTDIGGRCVLTNEGCAFNEKECLRRPEIVRYFLEGQDEKIIESDGEFLKGRKPFVMRPLRLREEKLNKIYSLNILNRLERL